MRRRDVLLAAAGSLAVPRVVFSQASGKIARIGYLGNSTMVLESRFVEAFLRGMQSQGHAEGRNFTISYLWAEGKNERLPNLAAEFVRLKMDVILTAGTPGGNLTGLATLANELEGKRLELLKEMRPRTLRVAVLMNPGNPFTPIAWRGMQEGARKLRLVLLPEEVASPERFEAAFSSMKTAKALGIAIAPAVRMRADRVFE